VMLVDANILLYAEDSFSPHHREARVFWDSALSGSESVYLCWTVISAFIRISTNHRVFERPLTLDQALDRVRSWLRLPCVRIAVPTDNHWNVFSSLLEAGQAVGNLVTDAHIAALAREYGLTLYSTDSDFSRFPGVTWINPVVP
jgi:uncharacterized protein